jgi:iron complex transport system permease protein
MNIILDSTGARRGVARQDGHRFAGPAEFRVLLAALGAVLAVLVLVSVVLGPVRTELPDVWRVLVAHLTGHDADVDPVTDQIVWTVRLPRTVLAVLVGSALAVAGTVIQAVVRNPLGDPYLIGIVPGAALGAVLVIVAGSAAVGGLSLSTAAFLGALAAFALTFTLGRHRGEWPANRVVLAGVAVGYLLSAATYFLQTMATPSQVQRVLFWSLGSVSGATWSDLPVLVAVVGVGTAWLLTRGTRLNALVSGHDLSRSLGVELAAFQLQLMLLAALVTGAVVAVAGGIGFVGLMVPHLARLLVGSDHRRVLLCSLPLGAVTLLSSDLVARVALAPAELPIGIVTAAAGAPFFLWLLTSSRTTAAAR